VLAGGNAAVSVTVRLSLDNTAAAGKGAPATRSATVVLVMVSGATGLEKVKTTSEFVAALLLPLDGVTRMI
jgi:hypothetical protein